MKRGLIYVLAVAAVGLAAADGALAGDLSLYPNKPGKKTGATGQIGAVIGPAPPAGPDVVLGAAGRLRSGRDADYGFVGAPDSAARDGPETPGVEIGFRARTLFRNKGPGS